MEREWKGWKLDLKTEPTDGLKEVLKRNKEDLKRNKPEQGMEEYSFGLGDVEVNGEMKRYQLEVEKYRTWKRKILELSNLFPWESAFSFHQREGDTGWWIGFVRKSRVNSHKKTLFHWGVNEATDPCTLQVLVLANVAPHQSELGSWKVTWPSSCLI